MADKKVSSIILFFDIEIERYIILAKKNNFVDLEILFTKTKNKMIYTTTCEFKYGS